MGAQVQAADDENISDPDGSELSGGSENASNPLAAVNNTDLRWQYSDLTTNDDRLYDYFIEGAVTGFMIGAWDWGSDSIIELTH